MILKYSWIKMNDILKEKLLKFTSIKFHLEIDVILFFGKNDEVTSVCIKNVFQIFQIENMIYYHYSTNNHEIYIIILNNKSFKSILREGWNIIYKRRKKNYLKKKNKSNVIIDFLGYVNKSKSGKLFSCEISKRAKLIEKGLVIPTKIMKIFLYNIFEKKPLLTFLASLTESIHPDKVVTYLGVWCLSGELKG